MRYFSIIILAANLTLLVITGCGHTKVADMRLEDIVGDESSVVFGTFRIFYNGKSATSDSLITMDNGETIQIGNDGFAAFKAKQGRLSLKQIKVPNSGTEFTFNNLGLRAGPPGSKTYFGEISIVIFAPPPTAIDRAEKWNWQVANKWADAWKLWTAHFGADQGKTYSGLAEKTGPDRIQTRNIATDRPDVIPNF